MIFQKISALFLLMALTSCSIQKRHYLNGYYIAKHNVVNEKNETWSSQELPQDTFLNHSLTAAANQFQILEKEQQFLLNAKASLGNCDTIFLKKRDKIIICKIQRITKMSFLYKLCNDSIGQTYRIPKRKVDGYTYKPYENKIITTGHGGPRASLLIRSNRPNYKLNPSASLGLLLCFFLFVGAGAIILGSVGLAQISRHPEKYYGWTIALIATIAGILEAIAFLAFILLVLG